MNFKSRRPLRAQGLVPRKFRSDSGREKCRPSLLYEFFHRYLAFVYLRSGAPRKGALFLSAGLFVGLLTTKVLGQVDPGGGDIQTVVFAVGIDTTLAASGLNGPDAPHGAIGTNPDGIERWEWDGADAPQGHVFVGKPNHGLLWFDIPQNVLSSFGNGRATLALHLDDAGNAAEMYRLTSDWLSGPDGGDGVTFNNIPGGPGVVPGQNAEASSNVIFPDTISMPELWGKVVELDVSADVKAWADGLPNYGWGFVPVGANGAAITSFENTRNPVPTLTLSFSGDRTPVLQAGDADQDLDFDQLDLVQVQVGAKYLTGQTATWGEGDWNAAPGGSPGNPPAGDGLFNQFDIIAASVAGFYLQGPYAAIQIGGTTGDGQTSLVYNAGTGELSVDAPAGQELTSINVTSAGGRFIGNRPTALDGAFDNFAADNVFKATFGGSFGSIRFGNVLPAGIAEGEIAADLSAVGSLAGGGDLGNVDLVYVPEPASMLLLIIAFSVALPLVKRRHP